MSDVLEEYRQQKLVRLCQEARELCAADSGRSAGFGCLFVVACSQRKTAALKAGPTPARDAYDGTAFKLARRRLENAGAKWCILSGHYGFLWPDTVIEYYDVKMDPDPERPWAGEFDAIKQKQYGRLRSAERVVVLGSRLYARTAEVMLGRNVEAPLAGLPIGKALQKLSSGVWLSHPHADPAPFAAAHGSAFLCVDSWAGRRETPVEIVGPYSEKRADRTVIRAITETRLPGGRVLQPGHETTVPTWALRRTANIQGDSR